ncbi:transglycosylase domain-containing protein [Brevibacterium daeguense]|uniref:Transglycosylase domain-containing protein n=1 Tax=Brevibacterium daeguense TaxID=909936 RepID=A0ABP8EKX2_9MICO|nr:transglycosylase domain-containing protein [Brevibacterium daeguense]
MVSPASDSHQGKLQAWFQFIAVSVIAGVVGAGLAIPSVGVASAGAESAVDIFQALPAELEERPLAEQSRMLAADGSEIATFYWQNRREVPLEEISQEMQDATIAVEDARFYDHGGVDLQGIARAVVHNVLSDQTQGGSTLTQQYVKNVLADNAHAAGNREGVEAATESEGTAGYARKLREAKLAVAVENKYSKDEILNRYLNINNYSGSPNVYGVEAAAYRYWGKSAADLSIAEAAMLAGIVKNPSAFNPERFPEQTLERRNVVLGLMLQHEKISQEEYDEAVKTDLALDIHTTPNGCAAAGNMAYFCDYVQRVIENDAAFGETKEARQDFLQRGGLTIKTSIVPDIQKAADKEVKKRVPVGDPSGAGHAAVTVEPGTGKVIAMAQNRNYAVAEGEKGSDTQINFNVDNAHNGANGFQVGSTWKPFVLTEWLKSGRGLDDKVNATKRGYPASSWRYEGCEGYPAAWAPSNAGDGKGSSSMSVLQATKSSVNTGYAAMANQLNMCGIVETAMDLGLKQGTGESLDEPDKDTGLVPALMPSSVLGTNEVAPIDLASAYAVFASGGTYCRPSPITEITDRDGEKAQLPDAGCTRVLDEKIADTVAYALSQTFNGGTTSSLKISAPAAAKTGTTNFEVGHTWLVGFTKTLSTAVWTGHPDKSMDWRTNSKGTVRGFVYGATYSGKTWQAYMDKAVKHTKGNTGFPRPSGTSGGSAGGSSGGSDDPAPAREQDGGNEPDARGAGQDAREPAAPAQEQATGDDGGAEDSAPAREPENEGDGATGAPGLGG